MSASEKNKICKFLKNLLSIKRSGLEDKASNWEGFCGWTETPFDKTTLS